ncbi:MAG: SHOCT domain-containing protein [Pseudomonadota bacterium]
MSIADEVEKLERLRADGSLTDAEFEAAKKKLLTKPAPKSENSSISSVLWVLVVVVVVAAGAVLFLLQDISESVRLAAGGAGVLAAVSGSVMGMMEDASFLTILLVSVCGIAIGAVAFLAVAPIVLPVVLVVAAVGAAWAWFGDITG